MTYKDYKWEIYKRWKLLAQDPATCPKNIEYHESPLLDGEGICLKWGKGWLVVFSMWEFCHEYGGDRSIRQKIIRYMPDACSNHKPSIGKVVEAGSEREIRTLLLMARAFCDKEAIEVLDGFLRIEQSPELEYAYLFSERYPHPE